MPNTFMPSAAALTLSAVNRQQAIDEPHASTSVVDPRQVNDERNPLYKTAAEDINALPAFMKGVYDDKPYRVLPGGKIVKRGEVVVQIPVIPRQVSLGHNTRLNPTSGRHL